MKKYILLLATAGLLSSCYDLDQYPHDKINAGSFWKTEADAHQAMMGVYNIMKNENLFGSYYSYDGLGDIGYGMAESVQKGTYTFETGEIKNKWAVTYEGIARANLVIQHLDQVEMSDELKSIYRAEARFMRGMYYFHLMDFYGGVPLYDETTIVNQEFMNMKKPRSTVEETRKFVLDDLDAAVNGLPVKWEQSEYGRATRGAAVALRGKVYLFNKEYAKAKADFDEIVKDPSGRGYGYELYPDYAELFKPGGDESSEMIFAIQNMSGIGTEYGMPFGLRLGSRSSYGSGWNNFIPVDIFVDTYENLDGTPFCWDDYIPGFTTSKEIQNETFLATMDGGLVKDYPARKDLVRIIYENRDPRLEQTVITPYAVVLGAVGTTPRWMEFVLAPGTNENNGYIRNNRGWFDYLWKKFVPEGDMNGMVSNREHVPINFPLIRYADVLLMLAECENELGNLDVAVSLINQVRQRPSTHMPAINSGAAWLEARTKEAVFERIVHERAVELACEGHRFGDLKRWKMCKERLNYTYDDLLGKDRFKHVFTDRDYLWPLPKEEVVQNPDLGKQNPGW